MGNKTSCIALGLLLACLSVYSSTAYSAQIVVSQRDSTETLSFADTSAFSDASQHTTTALTLWGNAGDTRYFGYTIPHGETNFQVTSSSADFSVSPLAFTAGNPNDTQAFTITALNAPSSGLVTVNQDLAANVAPAGAINSLSSGVSGGYNYLDEIYNPTANQVAGGTFNFTAIINGNYSASGTTTGSHQLIGINSFWTIGQNFTFDGTNTIFTASISNYDPAANQINLEYKIFGASTAMTAVPVPAAVWLFGSALASFVGFNRRKHMLQAV
jgi:hypothetical protein